MFRRSAASVASFDSFIKRTSTGSNVIFNEQKSRTIIVAPKAVCGSSCGTRNTPYTRWQSSRPFTSDIENSKNAKNPSSGQLPPLPPLMPVPFYHMVSGVPLYKPFGRFAEKYVIGPIEQNFDVAEFSRGAKEALIVVSERLAGQQYDQLKRLVSPYALPVLEHNIKQMSEQQRQQISIGRDDIITAYPYQVNSDFYMGGVPYLEITVVFHVVKRGFEHLNQFDMSRLLEIAENTKLCYCSFISELEDCSDKSDDDSDTDESDAFIEFDWSINHLNHIKIIDFVNRSLK